jgi:two-component system, NarL family, response regulator NreC
MSKKLHLVGRAQEPGHGPPIRVILADGQLTMLRSLRLLLAGELDIEVLGEARNLADAACQVRAWRPQVLVVDLRLPGGSGAEMIDTLSRQSPTMQIVVLTMDHSVAFAKRVLDAGAIGFVLKDTADTELAQAIRRAANGERFTSPRVAEVTTNN